MNISRWVSHHAEWAPEKEAILFEGQTITYDAMEQRIARLAGALVELGVEPGDRVAHLGYNSAELLESLFACARIGAMLVTLNWRLTAAEHQFIFGNCTPKAIIADPEFREHIDAMGGQTASMRRVLLNGLETGRHLGTWLDYRTLVDGVARPLADGPGTMDMPVQLVYTSGTTGRPKGTVLTQNGLFFNAINSAATFDLNSRDRILTTLPMFHVGAMNIVTSPAVHFGASIMIHRRFDPGASLASIHAWKPTVFLSVPATALAIVSHPDWAKTDVSSLKCFCTGSSTVPEAVIRPWHERGIPVNQVYGATETGPCAITLRIEDGPRKVGSCGKATIHTEARLVDDKGKDVARGEKGEIWLRGPGLLREYWNDPKATAESFTGGWFHTGDIGHQDDEGFYYVDDRKKDMVISGGENIYPAELENVLADCAAIAESAVVGRPDEKWGEIPVACIVKKKDVVLTAADVMALFANRLARYKHPRDVLFMDSLPRNAMGKVMKFELRKIVEK